MSGHSHWATIRRKKGAVDAKKGQIFSKLARAITLAAKQGGGKPESNINLQYAIERARAASMPKDNIDRAVKKGTGELGGASLETLTYEGVGAGGVLIIIECLTDNRNRTAGEIRKILELRNAAMGSGLWAFEQKGLITVPNTAITEDALMEAALEFGADDVQAAGDSFQVTTAPSDLEAVRKGLLSKEIPLGNVELALIPKTTVPVTAEAGRKLMDLLAELDDHEDVQNVYSNMELPDSLLNETDEE